MGGGNVDSLGPLRGESPPALLDPPSPNPSAALCPGLRMGSCLFPWGSGSAQAVLWLGGMALRSLLWPFGTLMDSTCLEDSTHGLDFHLFAVYHFTLLALWSCVSLGCFLHQIFDFLQSLLQESV